MYDMTNKVIVLSEGEEPKVPEKEDEESCRPAVEEVRTSITTTTMKKGNYIEKDRSDSDEAVEIETEQELSEDIIERIIDAGED